MAAIAAARESAMRTQRQKAAIWLAAFAAVIAIAVITSYWLASPMPTAGHLSASQSIVIEETSTNVVMSRPQANSPRPQGRIDNAGAAEIQVDRLAAEEAARKSAISNQEASVRMERDRYAAASRYQAQSAGVADTDARRNAELEQAEARRLEREQARAGGSAGVPISGRGSSSGDSVGGGGGSAASKDAGGSAGGGSGGGGTSKGGVPVGSANVVTPRPSGSFSLASGSAERSESVERGSPAEQLAVLVEEARKREAARDAVCREKMRKLGVVSSGPCIDVGSIVDDLAIGTYVFNKPRIAYVGEPFRLLLALKTTPEQDVKQSFVGLAGDVTERDGKFAQSLESSLRGDDLKIEPAGPQTRTATSTNAVEWEWTLTPQSGGEKTLVIEVVANIQAGPDRHKVQVRTLREPIVIHVSTLQRISMYVAEANGVVVAASATITAVAGVIGFVPPIRRYLLRIWRRRKRRHSAAT